MDYHKLGNTGMQLSRLGFGASSLGSVFHDTQLDDSIRAVEMAIENGINFIDVSPYYGYYKAEKVLGQALRHIPRSSYYLSTKVGRYGENGRNTWDYSAERVTDSVYESMERLGVDYIDLINVHDVEFQAAREGGLQLIVDETLPALVALKKKGVVGHVGITDLQLENLKWVVEHAPAGTVESVLTFCHYCLFDDELKRYLDFFEQHGVGVINASPFGMGLLTERGVPSWHPASMDLVETCKKAVAHCKAKNFSIERLAIQFAVSNPSIATTLFSSANPKNVLRVIDWSEENLNEELLDEVRAILESVMGESWENT